MSDVTPILSLRGMTRTYSVGDGQSLEVLKGIDLDLWPGEIVGLIGPSGSGKSSLLHAAGLLERPTAGEVRIDGVDCSGLNEAGRTSLRLHRIGFVYQFHHLLPEFSALDNVAMPAMIAGRPAAAARDRARTLLTRMGLQDRLGHQPAQMSGGEQQRVAIARALANRPGLILADEPTGNLDPVTSTAVFEALKAQVRNEGVTALVATHNLELASHMDRVFAMQSGGLVARQT
jgi:lipoprotein-releasing system ATP-binding protein